jgi:hypothetical protein
MKKNKEENHKNKLKPKREEEAKLTIGRQERRVEHKPKSEGRGSTSAWKDGYARGKVVELRGSWRRSEESERNEQQ